MATAGIQGVSREKSVIQSAVGPGSFWECGKCEGKKRPMAFQRGWRGLHVQARTGSGINRTSSLDPSSPSLSLWRRANASGLVGPLDVISYRTRRDGFYNLEPILLLKFQKRVRLYRRFSYGLGWLDEKWGSVLRRSKEAEAWIDKMRGGEPCFRKNRMWRIRF